MSDQWRRDPASRSIKDMPPHSRDADASTPASQPELLYFDDLRVGQRFAAGRVAVDLQGIVAFAAAFDPQPFHLDEEAGRASLFGSLVASSWHTMALTIRLLVESELRSP